MTATGTARGRKTAEHAQATRAALVELAGHLFAERGYIQTSVRDIARQARCTSGAIYGHFRNKADLLAEVVSVGIATIYVMMTLGYPQSCRSSGIGFGMLTGRVGAILASLGGGYLIDLGAGSLLPFFGAMLAGSILVSAAALVVDRHVAPAL